MESFFRLNLRQFLKGPFVRWARLLIVICISLFSFVFLVQCKLDDNSVKGTFGGSTAVNEATQFALSLATDNSIDLSWSYNAVDRPFIVSYQEGSLAPENCSSGTVLNISSGTSVSIPGLSSGSEYSFRLCAVDMEGNLTSGIELNSVFVLTYCGYRKDNSPYANSGEEGIDGSTAQKAFTICTPEQFSAITTANLHFLLYQDIDMSSSSVSHPSTNFSGTLHGNNKIIRNTSTFGKGLFNQIGGVVENLGIENGATYGMGSGLLANRVGSSGVVRNSFATGSIWYETSYTLGGLVGDNYGLVEDCYAQVDVFGGTPITPTYQTGGLVGVNLGAINNSYAAGDVLTPRSWSAGGLTGENNFATGDGSVTNVFAVGRVLGSKNLIDDIGPLVGDLNNGPPAPVNAHYISFADCSNIGTANCNTIGSEQSAAGYFYNPLNPPMNSWDFINIWKAPEVSGLPILNWQSSPPINSYCWENMRFRNRPFANSGEAGVDGTSEGKAFTICTAAQFEEIGPVIGNYDKYFRMEANINMGHRFWEPFSQIGTLANPFIGSFNGNFKKIYYFRPKESISEMGIFGYVGNGGVVKNLGLVKALVEGHENIGGLIGRLDGVAQKVFVTGTVKGDDLPSNTNVGGIVGLVGPTGSLSDCFSNVTLPLATDSNNVGGIAGKVQGTVTNCYARGNITGSRVTGGLFGQVDKSMGGAALVSNSFSAVATVTSSETSQAVGISIGQLNAGGAANNIYFDESASCDNSPYLCVGLDGMADSTTGVNLSQNPGYFFFKENPPLNSWDFNSIWQENKDSFPTLVGF